jgi:TatD DNase family protein
MPLIDSHSHFDDEAFDLDRNQAYQRACAAGVAAQIVPAIKSSWWPRLKQVCQQYRGLYPAYGMHPMYLAEHREKDIAELERWIHEESPVAVGECGLDFYIQNPDRLGQAYFFQSQLDLARRHGLPVIIHARRAVEEVINTLRRFPGAKGVLHSFSGSEQQARRLIDLGFLLSFGGPVTYPGARRLRQLVRCLPLDAMMLETDSPDQPDASHRGERNEPAHLGKVLNSVADLRPESSAEIAHTTTRNAAKLFGLTTLDETARP